MSIILKNFCYLILQITSVLSIQFLLRGHNYPGGGFIGALVASIGVIFYLLAFKQLPEFLIGRYRYFIATGIVLFILSITLPLVIGLDPLTGLWQTVTIGRTTIKLGTPLVFDTGVFLAVLGGFLCIFDKLEIEAYG
ncbi:MAG: cation:proton antiporter [Legionellales bacterium]|nr:cation:proton antiporter [Legionellales bacterium]|tara:strand:+ start:43124 stop:43534 length:411 start_codon:yes stop_codon:yes gene_type:complete